MSSWRIIEADCIEAMREMPEQSVQCCITSPPYFGLRDYGVDGQIGLEDTPDEYVTRLVDVFREVRRVLRDDGTLWLNLGDKYSANGAGAAGKELAYDGSAKGRMARATPGVPAKNLLGLPWKLAFALQADGWWLRSEIIWAKRNLKPENVKDRPTRAHEHIFLLTRLARYFYDAEAIAEPIDPDQYEHNQRYAKVYDAHTERVAAGNGEPGNVNDIGIHGRRGGPTRNKRSVWTVSTVPLADAHFAAYPPKLVEPMVLAGSRPDDTILDPFAGAGTTGLVALRHQRSFVGVDLNPDYCELARNRIRQDQPLFNVPAEMPDNASSTTEEAA